jgi:cholesterol oxidase
VTALARPLRDLARGYDAVVVGSGYGGGAVACRMARAGLRVAVLERGRELLPGDFPDTLFRAGRELQAQTRQRHLGRHDGLFDFRFTDDVGVLVGCGLGGTSLINGSVAVRPAPGVFDDDRWPEVLRGGADSALEDGFRLATSMLGSNSYPEHAVRLPKLAALEHAAGIVPDATFFRPDINVTFTAGRNAAGVEQKACTMCGDCVTGCNVGAKNTVHATYLADASAHGAEIYTGLTAESVSPGVGRRWQLRLGVTPARSAARFVEADMVVLAAGVLGSTEVLLRSRDAGLDVSPTLGRQVSGNADFLAFAYDCDMAIDGIGRATDPSRPVGPCITGGIRIGPSDSPTALVEEGAVPGALAPILPLAFLLETALRHKQPDVSLARHLADVMAEFGPLRTGDSMKRTQTLLVMGPEDDTGIITLEGDRPTISWPGAAASRHMKDDDALMAKVAEAMGGQYLRSPAWRNPLSNRYLTVHPLGGCAMADDPADGVVDDRGRVFRGTTGEVHEGLYVADGAVVPRALGANPSLTIAALAERIARHLLVDQQVTRPERPTTGPTRRAGASNGTRRDRSEAVKSERSTAPGPAGARVAGECVPGDGVAGDGVAGDGVAGECVPGDGVPGDGVPGDGATTGGHSPALDFRETLVGRCVTIDGRTDGAAAFHLHIVYDDVAAAVRSPATPAQVFGTVDLPLGSDDTFDVLSGEFRLLQTDEDDVDQSHMSYDLTVQGRAGARVLRIEGSKTIHNNPGFDLWRDTTDLPFRVLEGDDVVATGIVHIGPVGVLRMLSTMRIQRGGGAGRRLALKARFVRMFLAHLVGTYDFLVSQGADFRRATEPVPPSRDARLPVPVTRWHDGVGWRGTPPASPMLRLTRYQGGTKGPIMLAPGFSMSARHYTLTTTEQNLTEYLVEHGYDVWLFDYRASIDLPSARTEMTLDDIAKQDWPWAVDEVRRVSGAADVQVFAHCVGSMTLLMALLAGMEGVRHALCSQVTLHPVVPAFCRFKARIHLSDRLEDLGVRTISPDLKLNLSSRVLDLLLFLNPLLKGERCHNPVCRWAFGFYGPTHRHAQLNKATHDSMAELFGVGSLSALDQVSLIVRRNQAVDHEGGDTYLPHVERLAMPITFLAGRRNSIFLPDTSRRTLRWLQEHNDPALYERIVLPDYAHLDAIIGKAAHREVFPKLLQAIERHEPAGATPPDAVRGGA